MPEAITPVITRMKWVPLVAIPLLILVIYHRTFTHRFHFDAKTKIPSNESFQQLGWKNFPRHPRAW